MSSIADLERSDRRALAMLLATIVMAGAELSFDTALVVKITAFFGIDDRDFGLLLALTTMAMAAASPPWGYWADKYRRIKLIQLSQGIIAASTILSGLCLVWNLPYSVFFVIKVVSGLGLAGLGPVATSAVMDTVPLAKRGAVFGWVGVAWALGGAVGMLMPALCMSARIGLGVTYLLAAAIALAFTAALGAVREPRRGAQDEALLSSVGAGKAEYRNRIRFSDLKPLLLRPINLLLVAAIFFFQFPIQALAVWFITFMMRNHGLNELIATQFLFLAFLGQPFGNALGGAWTDRALRWRRSGRVWVMIGMAAASPLFFIAAMLIPFHWIAFAALMILANFLMVASGPGITIVSLEVNLPEHRGTISALMAIWANLARALAWYLPPLVAAALGGRYDRAFVLTAAAYLPLTAVYVLMSRRVEKDLDEVNRTLESRAEDF